VHRAQPFGGLLIRGGPIIRHPDRAGGHDHPVGCDDDPVAHRGCRPERRIARPDEHVAEERTGDGADIVIQGQVIDEPRAAIRNGQVRARVRNEHGDACGRREVGQSVRVARERDRVAEDRAHRQPQLRRDLEPLVQPAQPLRQRRRRRPGAPRLELLRRPRDRLAKRGRLAAKECQVAVDPLQVVPRRAGPLGDALGEAPGLGGGVARALELARDASALALAFGTFGGERGGLPRQLVVAPQERAILVREADLLALAEHVGALGLDARGLRLRQPDPGPRHRLLGRACGVRRFAGPARGLRRLVLDRAAPLAERGGLGGEGGERGAAAVALARDGLEAGGQRRNALAER
jgi:hypothetical protein